MKQLQIGVIGSAQDLGYSEQTIKIAKELGTEIGKTGCVLVFGLESDCDSLSNIVAREAKKWDTMTVGFCGNKGEEVYENTADVIVRTGMIVGGGRELPLVLSCDAVIAIGGGSGTLTEMAIAYQANIPIIAIEGTGGWADKAKDTYLDDRKRVKVLVAKTAKEAVSLVI